MPQRALASVNLAAIERNVSRLRSGLSAGTALCAVVKADGYGHGALPAARAALAGGASVLGVATALEAADLRARKIDAPILVMGAISRAELPIALRAGAEIVAWTERFVETLPVTRAAAGYSRAPTLPIGYGDGIRRALTNNCDVNYEILCGVSSRVPRSYRHDGQPDS